MGQVSRPATPTETAQEQSRWSAARLVVASLVLACACGSRVVTGPLPPLIDNLPSAPSFTITLPDSFPAIPVELLPDSSAEVLAAQGVFQATEDARAQDQHGVEKSRFPEKPPKPWHWYRAGTHPLLAGVLPGTSFYLAEKQGKYHSGEWLQDDWASIMAIRLGKSYLLPHDLGQLLFDAGMRFEKADVPTWLGVVAVVWGCTERHYLMGTSWDEVPPNRRAAMPFIPALSLDSVHVDTSGQDVYAFHTVYIHSGGRGIGLSVTSLAMPLSDSGAGRAKAGLVPIKVIAPNDHRRGYDMLQIRTAQRDGQVGLEK